MDVAGDLPPGDDIAPESSLPDTLILVPVADVVLMPGMVMPLLITRPDAAAALQDAARTQRHVAIVLQREPSVRQLDALDAGGTLHGRPAAGAADQQLAPSNTKSNDDFHVVRPHAGQGHDDQQPGIRLKDVNGRLPADGRGLEGAARQPVGAGQHDQRLRPHQVPA